MDTTPLCQMATVVSTPKVPGAKIGIGVYRVAFNVEDGKMAFVQGLQKRLNVRELVPRQADCL